MKSWLRGLNRPLRPCVGHRALPHRAQPMEAGKVDQPRDYHVPFMNPIMTTVEAIVEAIFDAAPRLHKMEVHFWVQDDVCEI